MASPTSGLIPTSAADSSALSKTKTIPFPLLLHNLLEQVELEGNSHIIGWLQGGRAFQIKRPSDFAEIIMPRFLPHQSQYKSFLKQLGLYELKRITSSTTDTGERRHGVYHHPSFVRHSKAACLTMRRKKVHRVPASTRNANPHKEISSTFPVAHDSCIASPTLPFLQEGSYGSQTSMIEARSICCPEGPRRVSVLDDGQDFSFLDQEDGQQMPLSLSGSKTPRAEGSEDQTIAQLMLQSSFANLSYENGHQYISGKQTPFQQKGLHHVPSKSIEKDHLASLCSRRNTLDLLQEFQGDPPLPTTHSSTRRRLSDFGNLVFFDPQA